MVDFIKGWVTLAAVMLAGWGIWRITEHFWPYLGWPSRLALTVFVLCGFLPWLQRKVFKPRRKE